MTLIRTFLPSPCRRWTRLEESCLLLWSLLLLSWSPEQQKNIIYVHANIWAQQWIDAVRMKPVLGSYHALFWHCSLDLATDHLSKWRAVLWGPEAPLGFCSAGLGGGNPRRLASSFVHIHVQSVPLPHRTLENKHAVSFSARFVTGNTNASLKKSSKHSDTIS